MDEVNLALMKNAAAQNQVSTYIRVDGGALGRKVSPSLNEAMNSRSAPGVRPPSFGPAGNFNASEAIDSENE